jgi:hypothetical protein
MRWAIITGGVLEFVGGLILVWQLGLIRTVETGAPPWVHEIGARVGRARDRAWNWLLTHVRPHRTVTIEAPSASVLGFSSSLTTAVTGTTPPPPTNPTIAQLVTWFQRQMESMNELIEQGRRTTKEELDASHAAQEATMRALLAEIEQADLARRIERGRSGNWQTIGAFLILLGVILSTVGAAA